MTLSYIALGLAMVVMTIATWPWLLPLWAWLAWLAWRDMH